LISEFEESAHFGEDDAPAGRKDAPSLTIRGEVGERAPHRARLELSKHLDE